MLESFPVSVLIGALLGILSGLGIGGGSLLILWLTLVIGIDPLVARGINLLFFLPSAAFACWFRWKQGILQISKLIPAIISGCGCAIFFSWVGTRLLPISLLKKLFGVLLIATGFRELFYKPRKV